MEEWSHRIEVLEVAEAHEGDDSGVESRRRRVRSLERISDPQLDAFELGEVAMAKTFTAWQRHVRRTVDERNRGLAKGVAMLSGGVRYKCFLAWAGEARTQREERDAVLQAALDWD